MGVCINATNSKYKFHLSYSGFKYVRQTIADKFDLDFGSLYRKLSTIPYGVSYDEFKEQSEAYYAAIEKLVANKNLDQDIVDFLFSEDIGGSINYKTCRKLAAIITGMPDDFAFEYAEFREFLMECYSHRRNMRWR